MGPFRKHRSSEEFVTLINGKVIRKEDVGKVSVRPRSAEQKPQQPPIFRLRGVLRVRTLTDSIRNPGLVVVKNLDQKKRIQFATLEVREFPIILGDNPSCDLGPPLTIDWGYDPNTHFVLEVDQFEEMRGPRRPSEELKLDRKTRERALLNSGTPQKDIISCIRQLKKDQHSRMVSRNQDDSMNEKIENASRRFKKLVTRKSQYERDLEEAAILAKVMHSDLSISPTGVDRFP